MHYWVWLALAGGFLVLEILTLSLIFFSFAIAALVGGFFAAISGNSVSQLIGFAVSAVLTLAIIRPIVRKYLFRRSSGSATGVAALISQEALVLSDVTTQAGTIRLQNETWTARCEAGSIPAGAQVLVKRIDGAVAIVVPTVSTTTA